jgi:hypothetical protein
MSMKNSNNTIIDDSAVLNFKCLCRAAMFFCRAAMFFCSAAMFFCIPEGLPVAAVEKDVFIEF